jgi:3-hydroxyisobutyrate dehydrogenase-like beta-hydroxyacid dehydrogenase
MPGGAMARSLAKGGHRVRAWNRSPLAGTLPVGMEIVSSPAEARSGLVHVVTSTISVGFADELRARHDAAGIGYVSAPVFGLLSDGERVSGEMNTG